MHTLDYSVYLVWFAAGFSDLADYDVAVETSVELWLPLDTHQTMLLGVVQPVPSFASDD